MPGEFSGKVVVVTGGSRGIGLGIAKAFAREGAQTVLVSSSAENLKPAAQAVNGLGGPEALPIEADLREAAPCAGVLAKVQERFHRCDVLVNCAGATKAGSFLDLPDAAWIDGFALKFLGCVRLCRLFWPMLKAAEGHVINIDGGAARSPSAEFLIGGAVNAAMGNFSKGLSQLGKRDGINVNVIHPGTIETERNLQLLAQRAAGSGRSVAELQAETMAKSGIRRIGKPEDIAELAVFLCSERARQIQGTAIAVDGGATVGYY